MASSSRHKVYHTTSGMVSNMVVNSLRSKIPSPSVRRAVIAILELSARQSEHHLRLNASAAQLRNLSESAREEYNMNQAYLQDMGVVAPLSEDPYRRTDHSRVNYSFVIFEVEI